jgi:hypothetical protein
MCKSIWGLINIKLATDFTKSIHKGCKKCREIQQQRLLNNFNKILIFLIYLSFNNKTLFIIK